AWVPCSMSFRWVTNKTPCASAFTSTVPTESPSAFCICTVTAELSLAWAVKATAVNSASAVNTNAPRRQDKDNFILETVGMNELLLLILNGPSCATGETDDTAHYKVQTIPVFPMTAIKKSSELAKYRCPGFPDVVRREFRPHPAIVRN